MQIAPKQISLRLPREGLLKNHNVEFGLILLAIRHPAHHPQWCAFFYLNCWAFHFYPAITL
jgi:hypothetical protein